MDILIADLLVDLPGQGLKAGDVLQVFPPEIKGRLFTTFVKQADGSKRLEAISESNLRVHTKLKRRIGTQFRSGLGLEVY